MLGQQELRQQLEKAFLKSQEKNPYYSLRAFAKRLKTPPSSMSEILNGKRNVSETKARAMLELLKLSKDDINKIIVKVRKKPLGHQVKNHDEDYEELRLEHFQLIAHWYHFAILALSETKDFNENPKWISQRLNISEEEVHDALDRLMKLKFLMKNKKGKLVPTNNHLATPSDIVSCSIKNNHFQSLDLAKKSLEKDDIGQRDFSGITMAIDPKNLPEAKKRVNDFRRSLCEFLESGDKIEVFRLNIQLFPLSKP